MIKFLGIISLSLAFTFMMVVNGKEYSQPESINYSATNNNSTKYTHFQEVVNDDYLIESKKKDSIHVLIVTGLSHPAHNWHKTTKALKSELTKDSRMKVNVLKDPYQLESVDLKRYDVMLLNFNNWKKPDPSDKAEENLKRFVATGGGLVLIHFACGAFRNWGEFPKIAGKVWDRKHTHDPRGLFRVEIVNKRHPITRNMKSFYTDDELYIGLTGQAPIEVLAKAHSKITEHYEPMALVHTYGEGRVFNTPLGHDARAIHNIGTAELIRHGVAWAARCSVIGTE